MGTSYSGPANAVAIGSPAVSVTGTPSAGQVPVATDTTDATWQTPASATVSSVFGRTGAVTAASGDYTAAQGGAIATGTALLLSGGTMSGAIAMGANKITGLANGTAASDAAAFGQIPVPANGYGITGNTGLTPTPAVALTYAAGNIPSNVTLAAGPGTTKVFDTASLAPGTWKIEVGLTGELPTTAIATVAIEALVDTATATLSGQTANALNNLVSAQEGGTFSLSLAFIAVVTVAGTIKVQAYNSSSSSTGLAYAAEPASTYGNATGYTAVRIA